MSPPSPYPLDPRRGQRLRNAGRVSCTASQKMKFSKVNGQPDLSTIIYNTHVTLPSIPEDAYRYQLGAVRRSSGSSTATR